MLLEWNHNTPLWPGWAQRQERVGESLKPKLRIRGMKRLKRRAWESLAMARAEDRAHDCRDCVAIAAEARGKAAGKPWIRRRNSANC